MSRARRILASTAAVAAVTGLAVAASRKGRIGPDVTVYRVVPAADGWSVEVEGAANPESRHATKREAVDAAREAAHNAAPSRLVIHRSDGTIQRRHAYEPD